MSDSDLIKIDRVGEVRVSEPDDATRWQEGLIKQLTWGEPLEVRRLTGDWLDLELDFSSPGPNATDSGPKDPSQ